MKTGIFVALLVGTLLLATAGASNRHKKDEDEAKTDTEKQPSPKLMDATEQAFSEKVDDILQKDRGALLRALKEEMKKQRTPWPHLPFPRRSVSPVTTETGGLRERRNVGDVNKLENVGDVVKLENVGDVNKLENVGDDVKLENVGDVDKLEIPDQPDWQPDVEDTQQILPLYESIEDFTPDTEVAMDSVGVDSMIEAEIPSTSEGEEEFEVVIIEFQDAEGEEGQEGGTLPYDSNVMREVVVEGLILLEQEIESTLNTTEFELNIVYVEPIPWDDTVQEALTDVPSSPLRLADPPTSGAGTLQISYDGQWSDVCFSYFTRREADVVCRDLGYPNGAEYFTHSGRDLHSATVFQWIQCSGYETELEECFLGDVRESCFDEDDLQTVKLYCSTLESTSQSPLIRFWKLFLCFFLVSFLLVTGLHLHVESRRKARRQLEKSKFVHQQFVEPAFVVIPQQKKDGGVFPKR